MGEGIEWGEEEKETGKKNEKQMKKTDKREATTRTSKRKKRGRLTPCATVSNENALSTSA